MKHILFPTVADADAFIADLQARGAVQPEVGHMTVNRRSAGSSTDSSAPLAGAANLNSPDVDHELGTGGGTAEDAGAGAVKGTVAGALAGAGIGAIGTATGVLGATAATVATGGLALPVILGVAALGSGVGAAVGALGGAAGVDETGRGYASTADVDDEHYGQMDSAVNAGGRAIAVDDNVDSAVLDAAVRAHNGRYV